MKVRRNLLCVLFCKGGYMRDVRIGVNLLSYGLRGAWLTLSAWQAAVQAGFDFVQVLPVRGLDDRMKAERIMRLTRVVPIGYVESAWNTPASLSRVIRDRVKGDPKAATIVDWLCFPTGPRSTDLYNRIRTNCLGDQAVRPVAIEHQFSSSLSLTEIHPDLELAPDQEGLIVQAIVHAAEDQELRWPLVFDTYHVRRPKKASRANFSGLIMASEPYEKSPLGHWQDALIELRPYIGLVHVQPNSPEELSDFLAGKPTELRRMLHTIKEGGYYGDYVVELTPTGLNRFGYGGTPGLLADFRNRLAQIVMPRT